MNNKSRLQKARYLQNLVRDRIIKRFPTLTKEDIKCPGANENGADIKLLTLIARKLFPYNVECKNREEYRTIYKHFKQTKNHGPLEPLLVVKMNRKKPLVIIDMEHFFNLLEDN